MRAITPRLPAPAAGALVGAAMLAIAMLVSAQQTGGPIFGFTAAHAESERSLERDFLKTPSTERIEAFHRWLTEEPHMAGTPRDKALAEWTRDQWTASGLEDVEIVEHEVMLPWPQEVTVEMTAPQQWRASMKEEPIAGDKDSWAADVGIPHHSYSASGTVEAPLVYTASGNPENYDWLAAHGIDVKGKIVLVRYSVPYSYRGFKALTAQQRGAAAILVYSDPMEDGYMKGDVYPEGPWGPESHIQRGGIVYDFMVPGDPLTPGWASLPGARRIPRAEATSLPTIISAPLSYKDARVLLEHIGGPEAPRTWQGGLPFRYHVGGGPVRVRMKVSMDDAVRPIWTVTGKIRGSARPDEVVLLGNHRDAWIYGGVDPSSGSATMMELAHTLGALARGGARPSRTIQFASWDAEEFTLTSSTEWGEQFEQSLKSNAVAYINVDSSSSGSRFTAAAVPSLNRFIEEAADAVGDPNTGLTIAAATRSRTTAERGSLPMGEGNDLVNNRLGSGSDYTVFLNHLGVPIVDMSFDGPYGVYHSMYDSHSWVSRIGDPGFRYHAAMARVWGVMALRLANADVLPLDYRPYAARVKEFLDGVIPRESGIGDPGSGSGEKPAPDVLAPARAAQSRFAKSADAIAGRVEAALRSGDRAATASLNKALMAAERALLDPDGIPGRPWYRHQIYAPEYTYAPEVLPGVAEAVAARDGSRLAAQVQRLSAALERAAGVLDAR